MSQLLHQWVEGLRASTYWSNRPPNRRIRVARVLAVGGALAGNWWAALPFIPGMLVSTNAFFSNIEATGQPHAAVLQALDLLGGCLLTAALLLRGPAEAAGGRREWSWVVLYAVCGAVGGAFPFACPEGSDAGCRWREWTLALPSSHYVHMLSGVLEFFAGTVAIYLAHRRCQGTAGVRGRLFGALLVILAMAYPVLGVAYLANRWGAFIEPVFFVAFTIMVLSEVFEPGPSTR